MKYLLAFAIGYASATFAIHAKTFAGKVLAAACGFGAVAIVIVATAWHS